MEKLLSVHEKKAITKQSSKTKKANKAVKVVYISNPIRIKTTASEFKALVQELTGRDSAAVPEPTKYSDIDGPDHGIKEIIITDDDHHHHNHHVVLGDQGVVPRVMELPDCDLEALKTADLTFEPYDDVFTPQVFENFSGFLPSSFFYESPHHVDVLRSL